ncbi:MAG: hypothetical protein DI616_03430 [Paracoccus denitrificans]|uniref:Glycine-rich domain-containing protein-like protein n=1 Tax=Paracoccus denitrificans TaxID=266 RepID=A0A533ICI1_PARDE|nr:MAG: hypothetical protein DI616_03430 [Paracoccus denitrificans]
MRNPELWQRLQATPITMSDQGDLSALVTDTFDVRPGYTARLLTEYRRFLYLVAISDQVLAPSRPIDQVWHLHLADTLAWREYSQRMFGRELRHIKGRPKPADDAAYAQTLEMIEIEFDFEPSQPFWPSQSLQAVTRARASLAGVVASGVGIVTFIGGFHFFGLLILAGGLFYAFSGGLGDGEFAMSRRGDNSDSGIYDVGGDGGGCGGD